MSSHQKRVAKHVRALFVSLKTMPFYNDNDNDHDNDNDNDIDNAIDLFRHQQIAQLHVLI